jgi:prevent-host-death family protein
MRRWQLQEAKQQFSRLVEAARETGPQLVTRNGKEVAVVLAVDEFRRLRSNGDTFKEFLVDGPDFAPLELERVRDDARRVDL